MLKWWWWKLDTIGVKWKGYRYNWLSSFLWAFSISSLFSAYLLYLPFFSFLYTGFSQIFMPGNSWNNPCLLDSNGHLLQWWKGDVLINDTECINIYRRFYEHIRGKNAVERVAALIKSVISAAVFTREAVTSENQGSVAAFIYLNLRLIPGHEELLKKKYYHTSYMKIFPFEHRYRLRS